VASDPGFVEHALDLVSLLGAVEARRMFGGHGLYAAGVMFALLDDGELFLKTDAETRARFVAAGCRRWTYVQGRVRMEETSYFRPPDEAHEDPEAMLPWARLALEAALRARAASARKRTRGAPGSPKPPPAAAGGRTARAGRPRRRSGPRTR
jgi:DNA transformation protein